MTNPTNPADYAPLALAGIVQAAALVHQTAHGQPRDDADRTALLATVPTRQAGTMEEIFPDPERYRTGARIAAQALSGKAPAPEVLRYTLQLIDLAKELRGVPQVVEKLGRLLDQLPAQDPDEAQLAAIYQQTISTLGKRIQVTGKPEVLQQEQTAEQIRALLLAGVRLAWLWHQLGGRRWHLILRRRPLLLALQPLTRPNQVH